MFTSAESRNERERCIVKSDGGRRTDDEKAAAQISDDRGVR